MNVQPATTIHGLLAMGLSFIAAAYHLSRFALYGYKLVSLALVPMCLGWCFVELLLSGLVPPEAFSPLRWTGFVVTLAMFAAIGSVEIREKATQEEGDEDE